MTARETVNVADNKYALHMHGRITKASQCTRCFAPKPAKMSRRSSSPPLTATDSSRPNDQSRAPTFPPATNLCYLFRTFSQ